MNDTAKGEIQSLVKLNLKLLNKDKRLGADSFREVARIATHTILAACGLEHSRSSARPFSRSVCKHSEKVKQLQPSPRVASPLGELHWRESTNPPSVRKRSEH
uniref:Uncharacterized protein n=1 Tax=Ananas comosus var. bracteatus TaxID=296719 RepID=A0A6V7P7K1_ANACO|nr:unnamed protein product [Ananas comosus var. bracteatus]